ncbi:MAG: endo-polygalacturonase [Bacteroidales bacterium]|nr:endo-polygalacturonase [Bacteroidales bacterium]MBP5521708.1 endo-polygalacturonase [Bacteroidales bacterium]
MKRLASILLLAACALSLHAKPDFSVTVAGKKVTVYPVKVSPADSLMRMKGMDDKHGSADIYEMAAFCSADISKPSTVKVKLNKDVNSAKVLPSSRGIKPVVKGREITFEAVPGDKLTLEIDGDEIHSLHIFTDAPEEDYIDFSDPNVIYYGPGEHHVSRIIIRSNQTLYIDRGAVLYGEMYLNAQTGICSPVISLIGDNIKVRGRGIVDGSLCSTLTTHLLSINGNNISVEGITLRDGSVWTLPVRNSKNVIIDGVKILGYRANSDGIDICNSENVIVRNCFIRTLDDLIVVKTLQSGGPCRNVHAYHNVLWNEVAHAVSIGAELRKDVSGVVFEDCDIIHDKGREWSMRVYHCDQARVSDIVFRNLRFEESRNFISLWINNAIWSSSDERGHIDGVVFENITADKVINPVVQLLGYDESHLVENVSISNVVVNGKAVSTADLKCNEYVKNINIKQ